MDINQAWCIKLQEDWVHHLLWGLDKTAQLGKRGAKAGTIVRQPCFHLGVLHEDPATQLLHVGA